MPRRAATRLRFGPYKPPRYYRGDTLSCELRGETTLAGMTAARIAWPQGKFGRNRAIIVCGDLVRALEHESACAVMQWWGVGKTLVNQWRRALGVPKLTEGDRLVRAENVDSQAAGRHYGRCGPKPKTPSAAERLRRPTVASRSRRTSWKLSTAPIVAGGGALPSASG